MTGSRSMHRRLCARAGVGVRMGLLAADLLDLELPRVDKRLRAIVETDGCFADGLAAGAAGALCAWRITANLDAARTPVRRLRDGSLSPRAGLRRILWRIASPAAIVRASS